MLSVQNKNKKLKLDSYLSLMIQIQLLDCLNRGFTEIYGQGNAKGKEDKIMKGRNKIK